MTSLIIIIVLMAIGVAVLKELKKSNKPKSSYRKPYRSDYKPFERKPNIDKTDYKQQLESISKPETTLVKQSIMNKGEFNIFSLIEKEILPKFFGCRVFAQTCLGEILKVEPKSLNYCINSKRIDIVIIDRYGNPIVAIECQGSGHYQSNAPLRDAVKKEALRKAGVEYLEIKEKDTQDDIKFLVTRALENSLGTIINNPITNNTVLTETL